MYSVPVYQTNNKHMKDIKSKVIELILDTEKKLDQAQLDGVLSKELWLEKRTYLRSVTYIAYDVNGTSKDSIAVLKGVVEAIKMIKVYN
ncbi:hypothetical protein ACPV56_00200 [Vibrio astriarenae]